MIYLDTCLLIYAVESDPVFGPRVVEALNAAPTTEFAVSPLVKLECLVKPLRTGDLVLQRRYESVLARLTSLTLDESVHVGAAHLRARFGLRTSDALHLACAQHHGCAAIWTHDDRLAEASRGLAVTLP